MSDARAATAVDRRASFVLVTSSLCVATGVHAALAVMHGGGEATAQLAGFELAAVASLACVATMARRPRTGTVLAGFTLATLAAGYALSRLVTLPGLGRQPVDVLGVVTAVIELAGMAGALHLASAPDLRPTRAPVGVCVLMIVYSFLVSFALPTGHDHAGSHEGHGHATTT